jgi:acyl-homoserine-lactone acylase
MRILLLLLALLGSFVVAHPPVDPATITVYRDSLGVPHIHAPTDAAAAYGLAWAFCEDDFESMQLAMLNVRGRLAEVQGKEGAIFDYFLYLAGIDTIVDQLYPQALSPDFRAVLEGYVAGVNAYANAHPEEMLRPGLLPITPQDVLKGYTLELSLMSGLGYGAKAVFDNEITRYLNVSAGGSNALAVGPSRTPEGVPYLLVNSHQPMQGRFAWYEAHVMSDQGWNMFGATFAGGVTLFCGSNQHLGWAHTNNYHNFGDVYELKLNPTNKHQYWFDGEWHTFEERQITLHVKVGGIRIPVKRTLERSVHGPVIRRKHGVYALRFPAAWDIRAAEQWFRMNKAQNLQQFEAALRMGALPMFNCMYADVEGNIRLSSEGKFPARNPALNWRYPVRGDTSAYVWTELLPYDRRPVVLNPSCGYLYNGNNTPLHATCPAENWNGERFPGLQTFEYNRGERFRELFGALDGQPITWEDFKRIKYDKCYTANGRYMRNFGVLFEMDSTRFPAIADALSVLKKWNRCGEPDNPQAAMAMLTHLYLQQETGLDFALQMIVDEKVTPEQAATAIGRARKFLLKHFGRLEVALSEVLRHQRGSADIGTGGLTEVPFAIHSHIDEKQGRIVATGGETYVQLVQFHPTGPRIWAANCYGTSARPESPHYTDQMPDFQTQTTRPRSLGLEDIRRVAVRTYHPEAEQPRAER